jgi:hypothetical protein
VCRRAFLAIALTCAVPILAAPAQPGLTGTPQLARVYDAILDARFDDIPALLRQACGPAPAEACQLLDVVATWWQIQLDPGNRARDAAFAARADAAIAATTAWTARAPDRAEAWFYLGGAYGVRARWRVLRGERLAAARDGKRIKESLERALALDPDLHDAYFGIGLYHYYADVAPAGATVLRWLMALPGGDRATGLREMLQARDRGQLLRGEADYQLHTVYLWYEDQTGRALALLAGLDQRHPGNPHFLQQTAGIEDTYYQDPVGSAATWAELLERARRGRVAEPELAATAARLGIARQHEQLAESDVAVEALRTAAAAKPQAPYGAAALVQLRLAQSLDRLGYRSDAIASYEAAQAAAPADDPHGVRAAARTGLRQRPDPARASAYRLSLEGWRALERGDLVAAAGALAQARALDADEPVLQYRAARLLLAQGLIDDALTAFAAVHRERETTPEEIYLRACVEAAEIHEHRRAIGIAIDLYRTALTMSGGDRRLKARAQRALTRLTNAGAL